MTDGWMSVRSSPQSGCSFVVQAPSRSFDWTSAVAVTHSSQLFGGFLQLRAGLHIISKPTEQLTRHRSRSDLNSPSCLPTS